MNLELFSCSGGLAEGLRRAGITIDMAFDHDTNACDSYGANLGHRPIQMDARDLLRMARTGWSPGSIELFVADPPCTPWSRAGKRLGEDDERDMLGVTVELVQILQPRAYLIANVPGLDDAPNWPVVQRTIGGLARHGYCSNDYHRFDAADFGVPQHRIRPFWFGHRGGPCLQWPEPTHTDPSDLALALLSAQREPWVSVRQALNGLAPDEMGRPVRLRWKSNCHPPSRLDEPAFTITSKAQQGAQGGAVLEWPWDRPSTTVDTKEVLAPPNRNGRDGSSQRSNSNAIVLSERAAAILQGFPPGWTFAGKTKRARWSQLGMAMPPPLAHHVGISIAKWLRTPNVKGVAK